MPGFILVDYSLIYQNSAGVNPGCYGMDYFLQKQRVADA
jgi:hypothetical protein